MIKASTNKNRNPQGWTQEKADMSFDIYKPGDYKFCPHKDCKYHSAAKTHGRTENQNDFYVNGCDYIHITGHVRGCKPPHKEKDEEGKEVSIDCTRYEPGTRKKKICPLPEWSGKAASKRDHWNLGSQNGKVGHPAKVNKEAALQLYKEGFNDPAIAREIGVSREAVRDWRNHAGLPPVPKKSKKVKEE